MKLMTIALPIITLSLGCLNLGGCSRESVGAAVAVYQCPQTVTALSYKPNVASGLGYTHSLDVVFQNTSQRQSTTYIHGWLYDKDGISLGDFAILETNGVLPGQKVRGDLTFGGKGEDVAKVVLCGVNPLDPVVANRLSPL
jgi:hypothetical protein